MVSTFEGTFTFSKSELWCERVNPVTKAHVWAEKGSAVGGTARFNDANNECTLIVPACFRSRIYGFNGPPQYTCAFSPKYPCTWSPGKKCGGDPCANAGPICIISRYG